MQTALVVGTIVVPPCVIAIATYGLVLQWRPRRWSILCGSVAGAVAGILWIFGTSVGGFAIAAWAGSIVLPPVIAGLAAGRLALKTRRTRVAFLIGLIVGPIVGVLTSVAIFGLYYAVGGDGETVLNTLDVALPSC